MARFHLGDRLVCRNMRRPSGACCVMLLPANSQMHASLGSAHSCFSVPAHAFRPLILHCNLPCGIGIKGEVQEFRLMHILNFHIYAWREHPLVP